MKKLLLAALMGASLSATAQYSQGFSPYVELGVTGGISNYMGDLAKSPFAKGAIGHEFGFYGAYHMKSRFSLRFNLAFGKVAGDDAQSGDAARNLSFRSRITEGAVLGQFNIIPYEPEGLYSRFSPYVFAGLGLYHYNPEAYHAPSARWIALQPLGTEGQNLNTTNANGDAYPLPYVLTQVNFPLGIGFKFAISERFNIGVEAGYRYLLTDYLDDVSGQYAPKDEIESATTDGVLARYFSDRTAGANQVAGTARGTDKKKDAYMMLNITLSYNFLDGFMGMGGSKRGCPTF